MRLGDAEPAREPGDMIAARDHRAHLDIDAEHAAQGVHVQLGDEAAADKADADLLHDETFRMERSARLERSGAPRSSGVQA
jgi:hypothetical protein